MNPQDFFKSKVNQILSMYSNLQDSLEKGGEGSRGGKVIGHTKSGKPIYEKSHNSNTNNYTTKDHIDASAKREELFGHKVIGKTKSGSNEFSTHSGHKKGDVVNIHNKNEKYKIHHVDEKGVSLGKLNEKDSSLSMTHGHFHHLLKDENKS